MGELAIVEYERKLITEAVNEAIAKLSNEVLKDLTLNVTMEIAEMVSKNVNYECALNLKNLGVDLDIIYKATGVKL